MGSGGIPAVQDKIIALRLLVNNHIFKLLVISLIWSSTDCKTLLFRDFPGLVVSGFSPYKCIWLTCLQVTGWPRPVSAIYKADTFVPPEGSGGKSNTDRVCGNSMDPGCICYGGDVRQEFNKDQDSYAASYVGPLTSFISSLAEENGFITWYPSCIQMRFMS